MYVRQKLVLNVTIQMSVQHMHRMGLNDDDAQRKKLVVTAKYCSFPR